MNEGRIIPVVLLVIQVLTVQTQLWCFLLERQTQDSNKEQSCTICWVCLLMVIVLAFYRFVLPIAALF